MSALQEAMKDPAVQQQMAEMQSAMQNKGLQDRMAALKVNHGHANALLSCIDLTGLYCEASMTACTFASQQLATAAPWRAKCEVMSLLFHAG